MPTLRIDIETYSATNLIETGVYRYAEDPEFTITLLGYRYGDTAPVNVIDLARGEKIPAHVLADLTNPETVKKAYNANFEITCLSKFLGVRLDPSQWQCTSVKALYLGLPGNLGDVARVIGLPEDQQKMVQGRALIRYFAIPCKATKTNGQRTRNLPHHDPEKWQLFKDYCCRDVEVETEIDLKLARFAIPKVEHDLWVLDQKMMTRGCYMDAELVRNAIVMDETVKSELMEEAMRLTGLDNPNSRDQLLAWLTEEQDEEITSLTKKEVPKLLERASSDVVRRVLELRQELSKTSVKKYVAMARSMCADTGIRGLTQFYGANRTGRWAGRIVQVQNLPQNRLKDIDLARQLVKAGDLDTLKLLFGNVPDTLSQLIRTAFVARPGCKLMPVDFSAIEARVIAWLAWCQWRLDVFATHGMIYEASAATMFKVTIDSIQSKVGGKKVKGPNYAMRQKGKVAELALGYQGGANALVTMGALEMGIQQDELEPIKNAWRQANPEIVNLWYAVDRAAVDSVKTKTQVVLPIAGGRSTLVFDYEFGFLTIKLPSGRKLFYVKPRIESEDLMRELSNGGRYVVAREGSLTYEGIDQKTKKWGRLPTYGGKLVENITQACARDCLREAMLALDAEGFTQLFTVHDEDVLEEPVDGRSVNAAEEVMGRPIEWAPGLLLRGDGFETAYYMKEID